VRKLALMLPAAVAILLAASMASHRADAMMVTTAGLGAATESIAPMQAVRCWRWGWHGWGWYPACAQPANKCIRCQWHWGARNCWRVC